jgi:DNA (cytosine-5)-methyltransferase 1
MPSKNKNNFKVLDLFCGCGGLSFGFELAGFDIIAGIDNWKDALVTFERNHRNSKAILADLFNDKPETIMEQIKYNIDVIVGGPPCQGFSIAGKRMIDDPRNLLYKSFVEFVEFVKPKAFVMENVPNIISMNDGLIKKQIIEDFENLGYIVEVKVLNASEYGVPQNRRRAFFVGTLHTLKTPFDFPNKLSYTINTREAISDLPEATVEDGSNYISNPDSRYQEFMRRNSTGIFNHQATVHNQKTIEIINQVPDGGNYKSLPVNLQATRKVNIAWTRMSSWKPCFTIDTGHNHHFHFEYNRVPTARESARIQSFPDKYVFIGNKGSQLKQIGNAVPPLLALEVAKSLKNILNNV